MPHGTFNIYDTFWKNNISILSLSGLLKNNLNGESWRLITNHSHYYPL